MTTPASQTEAVALEPCPFCGGRAGTMNMSGYLSIGCTNCGASPDRKAYAEAVDAIAAWNRRALPAPEVPEEGAVYTQAEFDEAGQIGERDGYEKAVQDFDLATGGDGEFKATTHDGAIDMPVMRQRVLDRFAPLSAPLPAPDKVGDGDFEGLEEMLADVEASPEYRALLDIADIVTGTATCPVGSPEWCALAIDLIERQAMTLAAPPAGEGGQE